MLFGTFKIDDSGGLTGAKLAHRIALEGAPSIPKGTVLTPTHIKALRESGVKSVTAAILQDHDIWEDEAAALIAESFAGGNVRKGKAATGRVNLYARCDGILTYPRAALIDFNNTDQRLTCAALTPFERVKKGQMIATIKIIPFGVPKNACLNAIAALEQSSFAVHPFQPDLRIGLVQTLVQGTASKMLDKTERVTAKRLEDFGLTLTGSERLAHDSGLLAEHIKQSADRLDILIVFGASAICDAGDVVPRAVSLSGGTTGYLGMPVDPGNLLLLGHIGKTVLIGAPGCARSPKINGFDWILERLCAGVAVEKEDIIEMSVGGLLTEIPSRPSPRDK